MAQKYFHVAELWRIGYRTLYTEVGERFLVILASPGVTSTYARQQFIEKALGARVMWLSRKVQGIRNITQQGLMATDIYNLVRLFNLRKRTDNIVVLCVHLAVSHTAVEAIKRMIPGVRVVSYIYDLMSLMVPPEKIDIWAEYHGGTTERAKVEYEYLQKIVTGKLSDGLIYKDYGPNWPLLANSSVPRYWMPQSLPRDVFMPPPRRGVPEGFVFIGTIVPKVTHKRPSGVFDDIMMEQIFDEVESQGYPIHAYVLNPHPDVIAEYRALFKGRQVHLFKGDLLEALLKRLSGRYKWGWMMYHYPVEIVMPLVRATLPTKFWTYLALGVPPVVSEEMEAVARIVRQEKCGVVVSQRDILNLKEVLARQDYDALIRGVLRAREKYCLDIHNATMVKCLKRVLGREPIQLEAVDVKTAQTAQEGPPGALRRPTAIDPRGDPHIWRPRLRKPAPGRGQAQGGGRDQHRDPGPNRGKGPGNGHDRAERAFPAEQDPLSRDHPHAHNGDQERPD